MTMKNILISQRHTKNKYGDWVDSLENNYVTFFESYNVNLIPISNVSKQLPNVFKEINISGIILTGGGDVNPALYGEDAIIGLSLSELRDNTETLLLNSAIKNNIPVIGICRGMQFVNIFFKGKILQNIKSIDAKNGHLAPGFHKIKINYQPLLTSLDGCDSIEVNSYHNQGILNSMLGNELSAFADYPDLDLVEGLFHKTLPIAGIQWHPERMQKDSRLDDILIQSFLNRKLFWK